MEQKKLYTAVGRLSRQTEGHCQSYLVVMLGGQDYMLDVQELVVWTALNWRICTWEDIPLQCGILFEWLYFPSMGCLHQSSTVPWASGLRLWRNRV